jgi:hypothetical protein
VDHVSQEVQIILLDIWYYKFIHSEQMIWELENHCHWYKQCKKSLRKKNKNI